MWPKYCQVTYEVTAGSMASNGMKFSALLAMRLGVVGAVPRVPTKAGAQMAAASSRGSRRRCDAMVFTVRSQNALVKVLGMLKHQKKSHQNWDWEIIVLTYQ